MKTTLEVIDAGEFSPCEIRLPVVGGGEKVYQAEKNLRLLPGRRMTVLARGDDKRYVIKIFPHRSHAQREYADEVAGYDLLHNASIDVPARIYQGEAEDEISIIVYQYLERARTLQEVFAQKPKSRAGEKMLARFMQQIARLHKNGFIHKDPHLGNFMVKGDVISVLDLAAIREYRNPHRADENLALFIAQFPMSWQIEDSCIDSYLEALLGGPDRVRRGEIRTLVKQKQAWRERHVLKKVFRECTQFHVRSMFMGRLIVDRDYINSGLIERITEPASVFEGDDVELLKDGNSSTVARIRCQQRDYVVKRYNVKNPLHRIKLLLRESRASRSWRNAHLLQLRGFRTPRPVAMLECMKGCHRGVSMFVMEYMPGTPSDVFFRQTELLPEVKRDVAIAMLDLLAELHRESIIHGDVKSTNFLINEGQPVLLDLDAMQVCRTKSGMDRKMPGEIERFRQNWEQDAEAKQLFETLMNMNL